MALLFHVIRLAAEWAEQSGAWGCCIYWYYKPNAIFSSASSFLQATYTPINSY